MVMTEPNRHCDRDTLRQLLDEELPRDQARRVEFHLSDCNECQCELEELAGKRHWWDETASILSESTVTPSGRECDSPLPLRSLDASLDWIRPLLDDTSETTSGLGRMDQYDIEGVIGQGGMGVVLRGRDPQLNRTVAIKVLSPHLAGVGAARTRFMREAQAAAAIVHPSVVPIYSVVPSARLPYIVMPCIHGGNLQQRIDREGPLELVEVLRIGLQIAEGLVAAHRQGVIHRDIKPANILIEEGNGRALISDFGLARALDDATLTVSGMIAGTPQYMSPEQARGEPIDARSDLFSLGSLMYALATGRPPFRAETPLAVLRKISDTPPRPIHQVNEQIPAWFSRLVAQLMRINMTQRLSSAEAVVDRLREAHSHVRNPSVHALPRALARSQDRKLFHAVAAFAVFVLAAAGSAVALTTLNQIAKAKNVEARNLDGENAATDHATPGERGADVTSAALLDNLPPAHALGWHDETAESELRAIQQTLGDLERSLDDAFDASDSISLTKP